MLKLVQSQGIKQIFIMGGTPLNIRFSFHRLSAKNSLGKDGKTVLKLYTPPGPLETKLQLLGSLTC